jgi:cytochrome c oxidase cbb3-type subunit 2
MVDEKPGSAVSQTKLPFVREEKASTVTLFASVVVIATTYIYFLIFAGFAFVDFARQFVPRGHMPILLVALGGGGVAGCIWAARSFVAARGRKYLMYGLAGSSLAALLTLVARHEALLIIVAVLVGLSMAWTAVSLSLCLRPTLHFQRLGLWCGLGTGLAYAFCNQPFIFEASLTGRIVTAAVAAALGAGAAFWMRGVPSRASSLPDYDPRAAISWVVVLFVLVFMDTLVFYIIQHNATLKLLSWETPLILQGNAFVHLCAAFITGLVLDQRWPGLTTLVALLLLLASSMVLSLHTDHFPKARMLYIAAVSIYSTVMIYLPARGCRPRFAATLFAVSGWLASALALMVAVGWEIRDVPGWIVVLALVVGCSALSVRLLWIKRAQEIEAERMVLRKPA